MFLNEEVREKVKERFQDLKDDVELAVFTQQSDCQYCDDNRKLTEEIAGLSDKISITLSTVFPDTHFSIFVGLISSISNSSLNRSVILPVVRLSIT